MKPISVEEFKRTHVIDANGHAKAKKHAKRARQPPPIDIRVICNDAECVEVTFNAETHGVNGATGHEWEAKGFRKRLREATFVALRSVGSKCPVPLPATVLITRVGPRSLDSDGVAFAVKGARDQIAIWCGVDDADATDDAPITWRVKSDRGPYEVRIRITPRKICGECGQAKC